MKARTGACAMLMLVTRLLACRPANPDASPKSTASVVALQAVDGGSLVTVDGQSSSQGGPEGCPSRESLALDALRFEAALRDRFGLGWNANVEESGVITATPSTTFEEERDTSARFFEAVKAAFPDLLLGEPRADGHRGSIFHCWPALVKNGLVARTRHAACIEIRGLFVDMARVDRSRHLPAFAPLLRCTEDEAKAIATSHAREVMKQKEPRMFGTQLVAECDASRQATSLVWIVDGDADGDIDLISVDAKTRAVVDARVQQLGN